MTSVIAQINYQEGIEEAWDDLVGFAPRLIAALAVLLVGWIIANLNPAHPHQGAHPGAVRAAH